MRFVIGLMVLMLAGPALGATCKISEYESMVIDRNGRSVMVAQEPAVTDQSVTYTTTSQSTAFQDETRFIRVVCDAKAHYQFGSSPSATANDPYLPADTPEYFGVTRGADFVVAFYDGMS